jgi:hypothetical protein
LRPKINDLGFVYPLTLKLENYIGVQEIVPRHYLENLSEKLIYSIDRTYLVGIKFAPCFTELNSQKCIPQIRLVFQGTFALHPFEKDISIYPNDDALHVFFNLSTWEFKKFFYLLSYRNRKNTDNWIHDSLSEDTKAKNFKETLINLLDDKTPYLITAMEGDLVFKWDFFKVYPKKSKLNSLDIFSVQGEGVKANSLNEGACMTSSLKRCEDKINLLVHKMKEINSPQKTHVESVDCASCHMIDALKSAFKLELRERYASKILDPEQKKTYLDLIRNDPFELRSRSNMRQLGYFKKDISVSERTKNELTQQLDFL